jgi:hypothetical protein
MNVARGYRRLAIAVVGSWAAVWGTIGGYAAWQQGIWSEIFIEASRAGRFQELEFANQKGNESADLLATAFLCGMLTAPLAIAFVIKWWVYRGFVPHDQT